jgi:hypothetical protein
MLRPTTADVAHDVEAAVAAADVEAVVASGSSMRQCGGRVCTLEGGC